MPNWLKIVLSFLGIIFGSGIGTVTINLIFRNRSEKIQRKITFLGEQLNRFYGPLHLIITKDKVILNINNKLSEIYQDEYLKNDSRGEEQSAIQTINLKLEYLREIDIYNENIIQILENNYSYIDIDDIDIVENFFKHYIRYKKEFSKKNGRYKIPLTVWLKLGKTTSMKPEFIERINQKFYSKKEEYDKLTIGRTKKQETKKIEDDEFNADDIIE